MTELKERLQALTPLKQKGGALPEEQKGPAEATPGKRGTVNQRLSFMLEEEGLGLEEELVPVIKPKRARVPLKSARALKSVTFEGVWRASKTRSATGGRRLRRRTALPYA